MSRAGWAAHWSELTHTGPSRKADAVPGPDSAQKDTHIVLYKYPMRVTMVTMVSTETESQPLPTGPGDFSPAAADC